MTLPVKTLLIKCCLACLALLVTSAASAEPPRLILQIAPAVAKAAMETGVAARPIEDLEAYARALEKALHQYLLQWYHFKPFLEPEPQ